MKHIKVCKPRTQLENKAEKAITNSASEKSGDARKNNSAQSSRFLNEGLGCVPIGNLVGRDS